MAVVEEIIRKEENGNLSFGNYKLAKKTKVLDFEVEGRLYKAKTFHEVTKLKRDGALVYESLPGTAVHNFSVTDNGVSFEVEGNESTQITLELEPKTQYKLIVDDVMIGKIDSTISGKVNFVVDCENTHKQVQLKKVKKD